MAERRHRSRGRIRHHHRLVNRALDRDRSMVSCEICGYEYGSLIAAERCADDDARKPRKNDWLDPDAWD